MENLPDEAVREAQHARARRVRLEHPEPDRLVETGQHRCPQRWVERDHDVGVDLEAQHRAPAQHLATRCGDAPKPTQYRSAQRLRDGGQPGGIDRGRRRGGQQPDDLADVERVAAGVPMHRGDQLGAGRRPRHGLDELGDIAVGEAGQGEAMVAGEQLGQPAAGDPIVVAGGEYHQNPAALEAPGDELRHE